MPSPEKTTVSVYLSPDLVEKVKEICRQHNYYYTKGDVSTERLGTGVVKALEMFFSEEKSTQVDLSSRAIGDNTAVLNLLEKVDLRLQLLGEKLPASAEALTA